ncbi:MAG: dipeptide/oligopeptide/nickel ABC transporter ATP-binding protein [Solibacillus sp.]
MISIQGVSKTYTKKQLFKKPQHIHAVRDVTLTIQEGSCFALLGQSGSGKSTLGKMLLGIEKSDAGKIMFHDIDIHRAKGAEKRFLQHALQVVFQDCHSAVNPKMRIRDSIAEPMCVHERLEKAEIEQRVGELLEMVGLQRADMHKYPHQFSGGQLQRITIARALSTKPKLIVLDESINSLDVLVQVSVLKLLKKLQRELKLTYFFITHDLHAVKLIADDIAIMHQGQIVEQTTVEQLKYVKHEASRALLAAQLPIDCMHNYLVEEQVV